MVTETIFENVAWSDIFFRDSTGIWSNKSEWFKTFLMSIYLLIVTSINHLSHLFTKNSTSQLKVCAIKPL